MEKRISTTQITTNTEIDDKFNQTLSKEITIAHKNESVQILNNELDMFSSASIMNTIKETEQLWRNMDELYSNQPSKYSNTQFDDCLRSENQDIEHCHQDCQSQINHTPRLQNGSNDEFCDETNCVEQVEIKELCNKSESSIIQTDISQNSKSCNNKRTGLHLRSDVVNKTLLRAVKRFYSNKFKIMQKSMVNRRFKNVKTSHIIAALTKFCEQQFHSQKLEIEYKLLAEFMMLFFGIKPKSTKRFNASISTMGRKVQDCLRKYSFEKFNEILKCRELQILIVKLYQENLDELFAEAKTMQTNRERYLEAMQEMIANN